MILALDCETSALPASGITIGSAQYPWPVSLAAVMFDFNGRNHGLSHSLIKAAGRKISAEATKIHGITDRMSESFGSDEKIELAELCERAAKVRYITGYNLQFDLGIIESALLRLEMTNSYRKLFRRGISFVDLMRPSTAFCKLAGDGQDGSYRWPTLSVAVSIILNCKPRGGHHDALHDAFGAKRLFMALHSRGALEVAEAA